MAVVQIKQTRQVETSPEPERGVLQLHGFNLACGSQLTHGELAWQSWGPHNAPVVIVLGGISAGRDIGTWWPSQCGNGLALDPTFLRLVSIDWIGGADAKGAMKCKAAPEGEGYHVELEVPEPIAAGSGLWIELESAGQSVQGSLPLEAAR